MDTLNDVKPLLYRLEQSGKYMCVSLVMLAETLLSREEHKQFEMLMHALKEETSSTLHRVLFDNTLSALLFRLMKVADSAGNFSKILLFVDDFTIVKNVTTLPLILHHDDAGVEISRIVLHWTNASQLEDALDRLRLSDYSIAANMNRSTNRVMAV